MSTVVYTAGAELPALALTWRDPDGDIIDLSTGWTFSLRIDTSPVTEKTSGITGADTAPNVTIAWAAGELDVTPGTYDCQLWARRTADSLDRVFPFALDIRGAIETST